MRCLVMGVVNVTPDSFSDGGQYIDPQDAIAHGLLLHAQGASILDVGGESTRPGAERVSSVVERERVLPVVAALAQAGAVVSIDTLNAATAEAAVAAGARIVNDVSGGLADPDMLGFVAASGVEVVLQHWRGHSADMYQRAQYRDIVADVINEVSDRIAAATSAGVDPSRVIVDPGIGFGKHAPHNWELLRALPRLTALGHRVLVGTSRKRFLTETLRARAGMDTGADTGTRAGIGSGADSGADTGAVPGARAGAAMTAAEPTLERRDAATAVTSVLAARAGVWAVRVHNVAATRDALAVSDAWGRV